MLSSLPSHFGSLCLLIDQYGGMAPDELVNKVKSTGTSGKVIDPGTGSPNLIGYNANDLD